MRSAALASLCAVAMLAAMDPSMAINNGSPDGNAHPAVGWIIGTDPDLDNCSGSNQLFTSACSALLLAPDVLLTSSRCVNAFQNGLNSGLVDELWLILAENPFSGTSFDCTQFRDIDETQLHAASAPVSSLGIMLLSTSVIDVTPAALPTEDLLPSIPPRPNSLTFVGFNPVDGQSIISLRRRSATGRTQPPLQTEIQEVQLQSPAGASISEYDEGGATFVGDTNQIVSMLRSTFPPNLLQRLDTPAARAFLGQFVTLP